MVHYCAVCSVQCAAPVSIHRHIECSPPLNPEGLAAVRVQPAGEVMVNSYCLSVQGIDLLGDFI